MTKHLVTEVMHRAAEDPSCPNPEAAAGGVMVLDQLIGLLMSGQADAAHALTRGVIDSSTVLTESLIAMAVGCLSHAELSLQRSKATIQTLDSATRAKLTEMVSMDLGVDPGSIQMP